MNRSGLQSLLETHAVPIERWGQGEANTVEVLFDQIESGEVHLIEDEDGRLIRQSKGAGVIVLYRDPEGRLWRLQEWQEFPDGRRRKRPFPGSVGEKMKEGEPELVAAQRAMSEELGIEDAEVRPFKRFMRDRPSQSFPGLVSRGLTALHVCELTDEQYKPHFIEEQNDKTNHFEWERTDDEKTYGADFSGMAEVRD